jgi:hypothetical protein
MNFDEILVPKNIPNQAVPGQTHREQGLSTSQLYLPSQLGQVNELLKGAEGSVTLWGTRCFRKAGSAGTASLDVLVQRVVNASQYAAAHCDDLSLEQRIAGVDLVDRVQHLLQQSDRQIQQANKATRLFAWVRNKFNRTNTQISHIVDGVASQAFRLFSVGKFLETFQGKFDENGSHPCCEKRLRSPERIVATQKAIAQPSELLRKIPPEIIGLTFSEFTGSLADTSNASKKFNAIAKAQLFFECKTLIREIIVKADDLQSTLSQKMTPQKDASTGESSVVFSASPFADFEAQIPKNFDQMSFQEAKNAIRVVFLKLAIRMKIFGDNALKIMPQSDHQSSYLTRKMRTLWNDTLSGVFKNVKQARLGFPFLTFGEGSGECVGLLSQGDLTTARATDAVATLPEFLGAYRTYLLSHGKVEEACVVRNNHKYLSLADRYEIEIIFRQEANELINCFLMRGDFTEQKFIAARKVIDQMDENAGRLQALAYLIDTLHNNKKWKEGLQACQAIKNSEIREKGLVLIKFALLLANQPQEAAEAIRLRSDKNMRLQDISWVINGYLILGKIQEALQFATFFADQPEITSTISKLLFDRGFVTQARVLVLKMPDSGVKQEVHAYISKEGSDPVPIDQDGILNWAEPFFNCFQVMQDNSFRRQCSLIIFNAFFGERAKAISLIKALPDNAHKNEFLDVFVRSLACTGEIDDALLINKIISDEKNRLNCLLTILTLFPKYLGKAGGIQKIVDEIFSNENRPSNGILEDFCVHAIHFGYGAEVVKIIQNLESTEEFSNRIISALLVRRQDLVTPELCMKLVKRWNALAQIVYSLLLVGDVEKAIKIGKCCAIYLQEPELVLNEIYRIVVDFLLTKNDLKKAIEVAKKSPASVQDQLKKCFEFKFDPQSSLR